MNRVLVKWVEMGLSRVLHRVNGVRWVSTGLNGDFVHPRIFK